MKQCVRSRKVVSESGIRAADVLIQGDRIEAVLEYCKAPEGVPVRDFGENSILPGVVETHAHINEPGRTEWEGFTTATQAAAAGGITTVIDMPLNSIPATTTLDALKIKARDAEGRCWIDFGFWGGLIPGNATELEPMARAGTLGFKAFMCPSGVDEFPMAGEADLREGMKVLARLGIPLLVHAELEGSAPAGGEPRKYETYLRSRPRAWENEAIRLLIALCRETRCRVHVVHLSSAEALEDIRKARAEGLPFTVETCPHYLTFEAGEIPDGATHYKCAPPIRERANRERLWEAVKSGEIDLLVSDHSPCTPALKLLEKGDFEKAWGGISSIQFSLPAIWTQMRARGMNLSDLALKMCSATARFAGIADRKGSIAPGKDADLVVFDAEESFAPDTSMIRHRHPVTPYMGRKLFGVVRATFLRGELVFENGSFTGHPRGQGVKTPSWQPS